MTGARPIILMDRYELGRMLGRGGMAEVYQGRDLELGRQVAIKLLPRDSDGDPGLTDRLHREARAGALLNHPNAVAIHDIGLTPETVFIVMEYVDGETLRALLTRRQTLPSEEASRIAAEICAALAEAHRGGLVHRDISPGNIMIGRGGTAKVMDFGIAHLKEGPVVTVTGDVLGTPAYISPEQAEGRPLDGRSDLYSLGCCLYEMVTGRLPFEGSTAATVAYQHVQKSPPPPRDANDGVPLALEATIMRALAKQPDGRQQTADEMKAALANEDSRESGGNRDADAGITGTTSISPAVDAQPGAEALPTVDVRDLDPDPHADQARRRMVWLGTALVMIASAAILVLGALLFYFTVLAGAG